MSTPSPAPGGDSRKDLPRATPAGQHQHLCTADAVLTSCFLPLWPGPKRLS